MLAVQTPWNHFFKAASKSSWHKFAKAPDANFVQNIAGRAVNTAKNIGRISMSFGRSLVDSAKELYKGPVGEKGFTKHAGKIMLGIAAASSILGAANTIYGAKTAAGQKHRNVFDKKDKITVQ